MSFRPDAEIDASFRSVEWMLDVALEESRAHFEREGISVQDDSTRSGFDGGGYPVFVWAHHFERREPYGSEIKLAVARLWYREPVYEEESQRIDVTTVAEIFQICKTSRVRETGEQGYSIRGFLNIGIKQVVMGCIAAAERLLAKH